MKLHDIEQDLMYSVLIFHAVSQIFPRLTSESYTVSTEPCTSIIRIYSM